MFERCKAPRRRYLFSCPHAVYRPGFSEKTTCGAAILVVPKSYWLLTQVRRLHMVRGACCLLRQGQGRGYNSRHSHTHWRCPLAYSLIVGCFCGARRYHVLFYLMTFDPGNESYTQAVLDWRQKRRKKKEPLCEEVTETGRAVASNWRGRGGACLFGTRQALLLS